MGGVERGTVEIAAALKAAGIDNAVVSQGGPMVAELEALDVPHFALPVKSKNPFTIRANASRIAALAQREGVTLMHVRSRAPAWSVKWASEKSGIPWIATYHGVYGTEPRFLKVPYNRIMLKGLRTICVSEYVKRHVLETYRPDPAKLVVIHRGADTNVFRPDAVPPEKAASLKAELGFSSDIPVITLPGRLTRWKGQVETLRALAAMKHRRVGCLFVGSDQGRTEYSCELRDIAATLPPETEVRFLEHSNEMPRVYAMSDIVVNASSSQPEAFGRVIPEAQAMGVITVGTAHGGACETIADGKTGFLVPPGDSAALAEKFDFILDLPEDAKGTMRKAAVESVRSNFSTARMCAATIALYQSLVVSR